MDVSFLAAKDNPGASLVCCIVYYLYGHMQLRKGPLPKCQPQQCKCTAQQRAHRSRRGVVFSCRMCTTPVLSSSTSASSAPPLTTMTTSAWWMWTADRASSSAATPPPNAWSSTGSSLRWQKPPPQPTPSVLCLYSAVREGNLLNVMGKSKLWEVDF